MFRKNDIYCLVVLFVLMSIMNGIMNARIIQLAKEKDTAAGWTPCEWADAATAKWILIWRSKKKDGLFEWNALTLCFARVRALKKDGNFKTEADKHQPSDKRQQGTYYRAHFEIDGDSYAFKEAYVPNNHYVELETFFPVKDNHVGIVVYKAVVQMLDTARLAFKNEMITDVFPTNKGVFEKVLLIQKGASNLIHLADAEELLTECSRNKLFTLNYSLLYVARVKTETAYQIKKDSAGFIPVRTGGVDAVPIAVPIADDVHAVWLIALCDGLTLTIGDRAPFPLLKCQPTLFVLRDTNQPDEHSFEVSGARETSLLFVIPLMKVVENRLVVKRKWDAEEDTSTQMDTPLQGDEEDDITQINPTQMLSQSLLHANNNKHQRRS